MQWKAAAVRSAPRWIEADSIDIEIEKRIAMLLLMLLAIIATNSAWVAYELGVIRKALVSLDLTSRLKTSQ
jgi:hypothetical protein